MTSEEQQTLAAQMKEMQTALDSNDSMLIEAQQAQLKPHSDAFAARIMNQSVQTSMAGTSAQDW